MIPTLTNDCSSIKQDLQNIVHMAEIFKHPLSLIYHVGKNLIVNGQDIFGKISSALTAYQNKDYYTFGLYIGQALDAVVLKSPIPKKLMDYRAYEFLDGYMGQVEGVNLDRETLYNNIDGKGAMIYGPVDSVMREFTQSNGVMTQRAKIAVHDVAHIFNEGGDVLYAYGILSE